MEEAASHKRERQRMPSLAAQVLIGLGLGIACGVFFGEAVEPVGIVGDAFIRLLQMTVIPYILFSLITGLGRLEPSDAVALALRGGAVLLGLWGVTLALVLAMPIAFPDVESASFFSSALVAEPENVDFLSLYIPHNPFYDLTYAVVPAVVLFSIILGVGLMGIDNKERVLDVIDVIVDLLMRVTAWVAQLAPVGVFALSAAAAGSLGVDELERLQVYVAIYAVISLLLTFFVLPGIVSALTPLGYRDVFGTTRDALVTAFATGNLLIVLPMLAARAKSILAANGVADQEAAAVDIMVPAAFNFPSCGKLLSLAFLPFAGWLVGANLLPGDYPVLIFAGVTSFFGQTVMAVPFMLDLLGLPADLFQIFVSVDVIVSRFGVLLAAMHLLSLSLVAPFALRRRIRIRWSRLLRVVAVGLGLAGVLLLGARMLFSELLGNSESPYRSFVQMDLLYEPVSWRILESPTVPANPAPPGSRLKSIAQRGVLRVGYLRDALPFAFINDASRLVGHDIDMAHELARALGARIEFVQVDQQTKFEYLHNGTCDIIMSGLSATPERAPDAILSRSYIDNSLSFLVLDRNRHEFRQWEQVRDRTDLRIGVPKLHYVRELLTRRLPNATLVPLESPRQFLRGETPELDAIAMGAEAGSAWTMVYSRYSVVVPRPDPIRLPATYLMPRGELELRDYVNTWIELKQRDGTLRELFEHWILGRAAERKEPRWSVAHNLLGWWSD